MCNKMWNHVTKHKCLLPQLQLAEGGASTSLTHQAAASTSSSTQPPHSVFDKAMQRLTSLFPNCSRCWRHSAAVHYKSTDPCLIM